MCSIDIIIDIIIIVIITCVIVCIITVQVERRTWAARPACLASNVTGARALDAPLPLLLLLLLLLSSLLWLVLDIRAVVNHIIITILTMQFILIILLPARAHAFLMCDEAGAWAYWTCVCSITSHTTMCYIIVYASIVHYTITYGMLLYVMCYIIIHKYMILYYSTL